MKLFLVSLSSWLLAIAVGVQILTPNTDDIFYALPALGFAENGVLAVPFADGQPWQILYNFPTYSFIQGLNFVIFNYLNIPIIFETYRVSHSLFFFFFLAIAGLCLTSFARQKNSYQPWVLPLAFVGLIGILPPGQTWPLFRPEPLGLLLIIAGFWILENGCSSNKPIFRLIIGSLLVGIPPTLHPVFGLISASVILVCFFRLLLQNSIFIAIAVIATSAIPLGCLFAYLLLVVPNSLEIIVSQGSDQNIRRAVIGSLYRALSFLQQNDFDLRSLLSDLVSALFFLPWLALLIVSLLAIFRQLTQRYFSKENKTNFQFGLITLGISSLFTLIIFFDTIYVHSVISSLILFVVLGIEGHTLEKWLLKIPSFWLKALTIGVLATPFLWTSINMAKHFVLPDHYLKPLKFVQIIRSELEPAVPLFISAQELTPLAFDKLRDPKMHGVHWLFPTVGQTRNTIGSDKRINDFLQKFVFGNEGYWLLRTNAVRKDGTACVTIAYSQIRTRDSDPIKRIQLEKISVLQESARFILIRSKNARAGCE